jgi:cephalosporin hydroxylase
MDTLEKYWNGGFHEVQGWVNPNLLDCLTLISNVQSRLAITGNVAEIGVYHGKFLLALSHMLSGQNTKALCVDVFDDQSKNLDGAGEGNLVVLKDNIERYGRRDVTYEFIRADSIALTATDKLKIMEQHGPFKLFSVDGCHTMEHTYNDLLTAQELICPGGVVILDDYMQPHWPGVTEAVHIFQRSAPRVRPFLYSSHKVFFASIGSHSVYLDACRDREWRGRGVRVVPMFGVQVLVAYP